MTTAAPPKCRETPRIQSPADFSAPKSRSISIACIRLIACSIPCGELRAKGIPEEEATSPRSLQRISWDEALAAIAERFQHVAAEFGSESILPYSYGGTLGTLNSASMDRRFFHRLGASRLERTICSAAGEAGIKSVLGAKIGTEPEQFRHSRYIIAWGANIHGNNVHLWPFVEEARRNGAKLVVIDPYRTRTAKCADWYLPINPGTDTALALGMMHVIIREGSTTKTTSRTTPLDSTQLKAKVAALSSRKVSQLDRNLQRRHRQARQGIRDRLRREFASTTACSAPKMAAWRCVLSPCSLV